MAAAGTASPRFSESGNWLITAGVPRFFGDTLRCPPSMLRNGADLLLVNKQIRPALARQADHAVVEVFNPPRDALAIAQLHCHRHLLVREKAQIGSFLSGIAGRRRLAAPPRCVLTHHAAIVADRQGDTASDEEVS